MNSTDLTKFSTTKSPRTLRLSIATENCDVYSPRNLEIPVSEKPTGKATNPWVRPAIRLGAESNPETKKKVLGIELEPKKLL
jgi:hypothetical protein